MHKKIRTIALVAVAMSASACDKKPSATADSLAAQPSNGSAMDSAALMAPSVLSDANIVYLIDGAHVADSTRGALAVTKGTHPEVRSFGTQMIADHHSLRADEIAMTTTLAISQMAPSGDRSEADDKAQLDALTTESKGVAWDQRYMEYEITHLRAFLETINRATAATSSQPLKLQLMKSTPILQSHLDQAIALQSKLPH